MSKGWLADNRADQVDESRWAIKSWFYNSLAATLRGWTPGRPWNTRRPGLLSLPLTKGGYPRKTNSQPITKTRMIKENLLVLRVVKPVKKGDIKIDTENINKIDLPGACRREEKGPVKGLRVKGWGHVLSTYLLVQPMIPLRDSDAETQIFKIILQGLRVKGVGAWSQHLLACTAYDSCDKY